MPRPRRKPLAVSARWKSLVSSCRLERALSAILNCLSMAGSSSRGVLVVMVLLGTWAWASSTCSDQNTFQEAGKQLT